MFSFKKKKLLQLNIHGIISEQGEINSSIVNKLDKELKCSSVAGLIIDINSPGGSPVSSNAIYQEILTSSRKHNKPVFAYISELGASGGYFIAASANVIYADYHSMVGSIGVRTGSFGFNELMGKVGVERRVFTSGSNKALNDPFKPVNEEEKKHLESMLSEVHEGFKECVLLTRHSDMVRKFQMCKENNLFPEYETLTDFHNEYLFSGLVFTGKKAKELGLVDNIATKLEFLRDIQKSLKEKGIDVNINKVKEINKKKKSIISVLRTEMSLFLKEQLLTKGM
jgi:protease-4